MTTNDESTRGRRSEGVTGPSREVSQRDGNAPGAAGTGQEDRELAWARRHVPEEAVQEAPRPAPRLVERKTELPGSGMPARKKYRSTVAEKAANLTIDVPPEILENNGELVFILLDHMDRIGERQDRKIDRIHRRLLELERGRRSP